MYQAAIVSKGDQKYQATTRHGHFEMSSDGSASNPVDTLLASLCACLGYHVGEFLRQERVAFSEYSVGAQAELTQDRSRLADIQVTIEVKHAQWKEALGADMLDYITRCHIHNTLKANSQIRMKVVAG